jgi:hypothetical protein
MSMSDARQIDPTTDASHHLPDGLDSIIAAGFDALNWKFVDYDIFQISYQGNNIVTLPRNGADEDYDVPDGVTVRPDSPQAYTETTIFKGVHSIHQSDFSTSISASLGIDGINASTSFSLAESTRVETDDQKTTTSKSCYKLVYHFTRDDTDKLTTGFAGDLNDLPISYDPGNQDNKNKFIKLFQKWGTHFLSDGYFGGSFVMRIVIDASTFDKLDTSDIASKVETNFGNGVLSGSASAEIKKKTMDSLQLDSNSTQIDIYAVGGTKSAEQFNDWVDSVDASVMFLDDALAVSTAAIRPIFAPIWQLADGARQVALQQAWKAYLPPEKRQDDALPPAIPGQLNTNVQAATDGFLSALMSTVNDGDGSETYANTDGDPNPATKRASAGVHQYGWQQINKGSLFIPVRANDYYSVAYSPRWGTVANGMAFQPFPLDFGDWEQLSFGQLYPARDRDGFVVASIYYHGDGNQGFIVGSQVVKGALTPCAASSVHWYDDHSLAVATESFCMPVVKGADFQIDLTNTSGSVSGLVFWIPMGLSHRMQPLDDLYKANQGNRASTHGILTGYLSQPDNPAWDIGIAKYPGGPSTLTLQTATTDDFANPTVLGQATVQYCTQVDLRIECNSATAVIAKGSWFKAAVDSVNLGAGLPAWKATIGWVGIVPA